MLIECNNLCIGYDNNIIEKDLNLKIEENDYLVIFGENGTGKTTFLKTILGLNKPISGEIIIDKDIKRNEIGYLPQKTTVQKDFPASIWEIVLSGCQSSLGFKPFYTKKEKQKAKDSIDLVGLSDMEKKSFRVLSGGQQQRVLLARAFCATQKMLILDEPVTGLDPIATKEMYELISNFNKKGVTIIMISHDVNEAIKYANKVLYFGSTIYYGTKEEFMNSEIGSKYLMSGDKENA